MFAVIQCLLFLMTDWHYYILYCDFGNIFHINLFLFTVERTIFDKLLKCSPWGASWHEM